MRGCRVIAVWGVGCLQKLWTCLGILPLFDFTSALVNTPTAMIFLRTIHSQMDREVQNLRHTSMKTHSQIDSQNQRYRDC
jgi:hypothetical protein